MVCHVPFVVGVARGGRCPSGLIPGGLRPRSHQQSQAQLMCDLIALKCGLEQWGMALLQGVAAMSTAGTADSRKWRVGAHVVFDVDVGANVAEKLHHF